MKSCGDMRKNNMQTENQIVAALRATLDMRNAADVMVAEADAKEAALDATIVKHGYDAVALMTKAYGL